jgi:putative tryptophan/tyrosine transport system substrate-binding protein
MRWRDFIALVGGAAAWPVAGRAQQTALPVIEYLNGESADLPSDHVRGFRQGPEGTG